ncbi:unnamed protein product, partial [Rotaria sp. Silwood2]
MIVNGSDIILSIEKYFDSTDDDDVQFNQRYYTSDTPTTSFDVKYKDKEIFVKNFTVDDRVIK